MAALTLTFLIAIAFFAIIALATTFTLVRQAQAVIIERLGKYHATLEAGLHFRVPFIDKIRIRHDMREEVITFEPQSVITEDNLTVSIDSVVYAQIVDPKRATYEIENYYSAIEQLTMTTLRNLVGSLDLEQTLTSRDVVNSKLQEVLDGATGKWGIKVNRVELKSINPPASIQGAMEAQLKAERERRAAVLTAEGEKASVVLVAEGRKQSAILDAEGQARAQVLKAQADAEAQVLLAEAEATAVKAVYEAIHEANPSQAALTHQYLQTLPAVTSGAGTSTVVVPAELSGFASMFGAFVNGKGDTK